MTPMRRRLYRIVGWYSTTRFNRVLHPLLYRLSGGRWITGESLGVATILVTTRGARTGRPRTVALYAFRAGDGVARGDGNGHVDVPGWAVIASRGGTRHLPAWYRNLRADPHATVRVGRREMPVLAHDAAGEEYDRLWARACRAYPGYDLYRSISDYRIPVVILTPEPQASPG